MWVGAVGSGPCIATRPTPECLVWAPTQQPSPAQRMCILPHTLSVCLVFSPWKQLYACTVRCFTTTIRMFPLHPTQYGIVDENNPYDKLQLTATLSSSDPLFRLKRNILAANQLSTMLTFDMSRTTPLPATLLPFMRLALTTNEAAVDAVQWGEAAGPIDQANETVAVEMLLAYLDKRLQGYFLGVGCVWVAHVQMILNLCIYLYQVPDHN